MPIRRQVLVLIPGLQGRHEWLAPAVTALTRFHVESFSLNDDAGERRPFEAWTSRIDALLTNSGTDPVVFVGHSFGGLVAMHYAAHHPERVRALILVSTPAPDMALNRRSRLYVRFPWLTLPLFGLQGAFRLAPEFVACRPTWPGRIRAATEQLVRAARAPGHPGHMADWVRAWKSTDLAADCALVSAPTLVLTGEPGLDRVVPVESSREYLRLIPGARHVALARTGHLGLLTRPDAWAAEITAFVDDCAGPANAGDNRLMSSEPEAMGARHD